MIEGRYFAMLGPPASGKGTQGRLLAERLGLAYLSTGSRLRREIEKGSDLGLRAKTYLDCNQYVPDDLAIELVHSWLSRCSEGWLLDGFPRSLVQARALMETPIIVGASSDLPIQVIHLTVPAAELRKRVTTRRECSNCGATTTSDHQVCPKCGSAELIARADDSTEGFEKRLQSYQSLTLPALKVLQESLAVHTVSGLGSRDEVSLAIQEKLR